MFKNFKIVPQIIFGSGYFNQLDEIIDVKRNHNDAYMVFIVDDIFEKHDLKNRIPKKQNDLVIFVNVDDEPKTKYIDKLTQQIKNYSQNLPSGVIGIGGGSTMDISKAVSLMLKNPGYSEEYQGWNLIKNPAIYRLGIPTLSGTGAETSRTTILTEPIRKMGINSDYTVFDQIVMDPELTKVGPKNQWFYTGMDCYIHCIKALTGTFLNEFSKAYGEKSLDLCRQVFLDDHTDSADKLMMASYFGGLSIAYPQGGFYHALSYGLSFVLVLHHGIGNCIAFYYLDEFYSDGVKEFRKMMIKHHIELPRNLVADMKADDLEKMAHVALGLDPLWENALARTGKN